MKFKNNFQTIVINGLWNNSIFSPAWVSKYLLPNESNIEVEMALNPINYNSIKLSTKELSILTASNQLSFIILQIKDEVFAKIGEMAKNTARLLVHTPVSALGINFIFESDENEAIKNIF